MLLIRSYSDVKKTVSLYRIKFEVVSIEIKHGNEVEYRKINWETSTQFFKSNIRNKFLPAGPNFYHIIKNSSLVYPLNLQLVKW